MKLTSLIPRRFAIVACAVALSAVGCRPIPPGALPQDEGALERPKLRIAFVGSFDGPTAGPATRAFEGARLALDEANAELATPADVLILSVNTQNDPSLTAEAVAERVIDDPEVVAVIGWPSTPEAPVLEAMLVEAGIAYLDVGPTYASPVSRVAASAVTPVAVRHLVPDDALQADAIAEAVQQVGWRPLRSKDPAACLAGVDEDLRGLRLQDQVARRLSELGDQSVALRSVEQGLDAYPDLAVAAQTARCEVLAWTGDGNDGAAVRLSLDELGLGEVPMVGADVMRNDAYLTETGVVGDGSRAVCSCALVPDSAGVELQAFIQAYQSTYGGAPGVYSMEGWDAGQMMVDAVASGASSRAEIAGVIERLDSFEGLARDYSFSESGYPLRAQGAVTTAEAQAGRWQQVSGD